eukprot:2989605-Lingulodinium_polyedra.AAC.1
MIQSKLGHESDGDGDDPQADRKQPSLYAAGTEAGRATRLALPKQAGKALRPGYLHLRAVDVNISMYVYNIPYVHVLYDT